MAKAVNKKNMRALSIKQPFAEHILAGIKKFEYRTRPTTVRGRVYIYAIQKVNNKEYDKELKCYLVHLPRGVLVGTVEITDCSPCKDGYEWHLARPKRLSSVIMPKNPPQPGLFYPF